MIERIRKSLLRFGARLSTPRDHHVIERRCPKHGTVPWVDDDDWLCHETNQDGRRCGQQLESVLSTDDHLF